MTNRPTILVVEDDSAIRRGLTDALSFGGYDVIQCGDGGEAVHLALESELDLVLLDVMLPNRNGFDILHELRAAKPTLPIIMVTARGAEDDRVRGLETGADDYVIKPFSARELLARVEAVLRRSPGRPNSVCTLTMNDVTFDLERREICIAGDVREQLTEREATILSFLAANPARAIDRDELLLHIWGLNPKGIETRTVDMHIARLREKLKGVVGETHIILTVRGKGYKLSDNVTAGAATS